MAFESNAVEDTNLKGKKRGKKVLSPSTICLMIYEPFHQRELHFLLFPTLLHYC
jgi:hypothetical protein